MKIKYTVLIILVLFNTNSHAVIDPSGSAQRVQQILLLKEIVGALKYIRVVNQRQGENIKEIYAHFDKLEQGAEFVRIGSQMGFGDILSDIPAYNDVSMTIDSIDGLVTDVRDLPKKSAQTKRRIKAIIDTRKQIKNGKQSTNIKRGVEYESINAENSEEIKNINSQMLAIKKKNERETQESNEELEKLKNPNNLTDAEKRKFKRDFYKLF